MAIPIFINCRDRLEPLLALLEYLEGAGHDDIVLLDNDSTYPPLLDYFAETTHRVVHLRRNLGRLALWDADILTELNVPGRYVYTDPDVVPDEGCPLDAVQYFDEILDAYPDRLKVGFGLRIDDIPETYPFKGEVLLWESQFWERPIAPRLFDAAIDTTFALYRRPQPRGYERSSEFFGRSIRTGPPYVARHTTWYLDDDALPADETYYRGRAQGSDVNNWGHERFPKSVIRPATAVPGSGAVTTSVSAAEDGASGVMASWPSEPTPEDEALFTPWAEPGWHSWNAMSPETEICEFVVALVRALRPPRIVETGTGQGFITRRVIEEMRPGQTLRCFESDPSWRERLQRLGVFEPPRTQVRAVVSPDDAQMARADLCLLDSDFSYRYGEIERWWCSAPPGSVLFVHDAGNGHGPETPHARVRSTIDALGIPGFFLNNPRGAFVGVKFDPHAADMLEPDRLVLVKRIETVEGELRALRSSRTMRYSAPLRRALCGLRAWRS